MKITLEVKNKREQDPRNNWIETWRNCPCIDRVEAEQHIAVTFDQYNAAHPDKSCEMVSFEIDEDDPEREWEDDGEDSDDEDQDQDDEDFEDDFGLGEDEDEDEQDDDDDDDDDDDPGPFPELTLPVIRHDDLEFDEIDPDAEDV